MDGLYSQDGYSLRFDWGLAGAERTRADLALVVDVLSFSTTVSIAVDRGMAVYPYRWSDESAEIFAQEHEAFLARGRLEAIRSGILAPSLSPSALLQCEPVPRLVLPSPNGSTLAETLRLRGVEVAIGCLRNASAAARYLAAAVESGRSVTVLAAGERWEDETLRPCLEDHLGAGAPLAALAAEGLSDGMSPEARAAGLLFTAHASNLGQAIRDGVSGRDLEARGFGDDVSAAIHVDASSNVPTLTDGAFALSR